MDWFVWIKVLHVVSVISWMAGLLYLPRLFAYHAEALACDDKIVVRYFTVMEGRLLRIIMNPAMLVVWVTGFGLAFLGEFFGSTWFQLKILAVVCLTGSHIFFALERRKFVSGDNFRTVRFFRVMNEVPTLLMIAIVVFVIVKP